MSKKGGAKKPAAAKAGGGEKDDKLKPASQVKCRYVFPPSPLVHLTPTFAVF
jgi:hypothetical protein